MVHLPRSTPSTGGQGGREWTRQGQMLGVMTELLFIILVGEVGDEHGGACWVGAASRQKRIGNTTERFCGIVISEPPGDRKDID